MTDTGGVSERNGFFHSVRGKLSVLVVGIILISTLLLTSILYIYVRTSIRDEIHIELAMQGESLREIVRTFISHQRERVDLILSNRQLPIVLEAVNEGVLITGTGLGEVTNVVDHLVESTPELGRIQVVDLDGDIVIETGSLEGSTDNIADSFLFQQGLEDLYLEYVLKTEASSQSRLSAPILNVMSETVGVVVIDIETDTLEESIAALRRPHQTSSIRIATTNALGEGEYLFATNNGKSQIALDFANDIPIARALAGETGFIDTWQDSSGQYVLSAYMPIGYRDWALATQVDKADAYAPISRTFFFVVLAGIGFVTLAVILATYGVNRLLRPFNRLAEATGELARGNYSVRVSEDSADEVGILAHSFNHMATQIEENTRTLEEKVHSRTTQLEESRDRLSVLVRTLEGQADLMQRDLRRAETIQKSLLPHEVPELEGFSIAGTYIPSRNVGGDLFNVIPIDDERIAFFVADAAGHGAAAALLSVLFKLRVEMSSDTQELLKPRELLHKVNESIVKDVSAPGVFVTTCMCVLNVRTHELVVVCAGHPPLLIVQPDGQFRQVEHTGPALGLRRDAQFSEIHTSLPEGSSMLLYTDGIFDVGTAEAPTVTQLAAIVAEDTTNKKKIKKLLKRSQGDANQKDRDDITFLLVQAKQEDNYLPTDLGFSKLKISSDDSEEQARYQIKYYEAADETILYLAHRITWQYGQVFFDAATSVIEERRALIVELSECIYMDSAMLGTLHEVVEKAQRIGVPISIQNVADDIERSFVELGLNSVLDVIALQPQAVPPATEAILIESPHDIHQELRVLKAHEELASLNEQNKEEFSYVVEEMQEDHRQSHNF